MRAVQDLPASLLRAAHAGKGIVWFNEMLHISGQGTDRLTEALHLNTSDTHCSGGYGHKGYTHKLFAFKVFGSCMNFKTEP